MSEPGTPKPENIEQLTVLSRPEGYVELGRREYPKFEVQHIDSTKGLAGQKESFSFRTYEEAEAYIKSQRALGFAGEINLRRWDWTINGFAEASDLGFDDDDENDGN